MHSNILSFDVNFSYQSALIKAGFNLEAKLVADEIKNGCLVDILLHSRFNLQWKQILPKKIDTIVPEPSSLCSKLSTIVTNGQESRVLDWHKRGDALVWSLMTHEDRMDAETWSRFSVFACLASRMLGSAIKEKMAPSWNHRMVARAILRSLCQVFPSRMTFRCVLLTRIYPPPLPKFSINIACLWLVDIISATMQYTCSYSSCSATNRHNKFISAFEISRKGR